MAHAVEAVLAHVEVDDDVDAVVRGRHVKVAARTEGDQVVTAATAQDVVSCSTVESVVPVAAIERIASRIAVEAVVARTAVQEIVVVAAEQSVVAGCADQRIGVAGEARGAAVVTIQRVVSCAAEEPVGSGVAQQQVVAAVAEKLVVTISARDGVMPRAAAHGIVGRAAKQHVVARGTAQRGRFERCGELVVAGRSAHHQSAATGIPCECDIVRKGAPVEVAYGVDVDPAELGLLGREVAVLVGHHGLRPVVESGDEPVLVFVRVAESDGVADLVQREVKAVPARRQVAPRDVVDDELGWILGRIVRPRPCVAGDGLHELDGSAARPFDEFDAGPAAEFVEGEADVALHVRGDALDAVAAGQSADLAGIWKLAPLRETIGDGGGGADRGL